MNRHAKLLSWAISSGLTVEDAARFVDAIPYAGLSDAELPAAFSAGLRMWGAARATTHVLAFDELMGTEVSPRSVSVFLPDVSLGMFDLVFGDERSRAVEINVSPASADDVYLTWRHGRELDRIARIPRGLRLDLSAAAVSDFCASFFGTRFRVTILKGYVQ